MSASHNCPGIIALPTYPGSQWVLKTHALTELPYIHHPLQGFKYVHKIFEEDSFQLHVQKWPIFPRSDAWKMQFPRFAEPRAPAVDSDQLALTDDPSQIQKQTAPKRIGVPQPQPPQKWQRQQDITLRHAQHSDRTASKSLTQGTNLSKEATPIASTPMAPVPKANARLQQPSSSSHNSSELHQASYHVDHNKKNTKRGHKINDDDRHIIMCR